MKLRPNMQLKDVDKGWKAISKGATRLALKNLVLSIGISDGMGEGVLEYAFVHEFGSDDGVIPERSYVRATFDKNAKKYRALVKTIALAADAAMLGARRGDAAGAWRKSAERGLDKLGRLIVADVRARIEKNIPPALEPETVARKTRQGMPKPTIALIGRGVLIKSVQHQVKTEAKGSRGGKRG